MTQLTAPAIIATLIIAVTAACNGGGDTAPVPRPEAYYRIEPYDPDYVQLPSLPVVLTVNSHARAEIKRMDNSCWIDLHYPRYKAVVHYSLVKGSTDDIRKALANRTERASLNTGGRKSEITELISPDGFTSTIIVTPGATVTPVQHIATDNKSALLYGSLEILHPVTDPEEIRQVITAVNSDIIELSKHLSTRNDR